MIIKHAALYDWGEIKFGAKYQIAFGAWGRTWWHGSMVTSIILQMATNLTPGPDYKRLDRCLASLCRIAMRGAATEERGDGTMRSLTHAQVLKYWRSPGSKIDLTDRRLKVYQSWAARPDCHAQPLCA
eukprot:7346037-Pyramimonas_sp.AAC.1